MLSYALNAAQRCAPFPLLTPPPPLVLLSAQTPINGINDMSPPLLLRPAEACQLLAIGPDRLHELITSRHIMAARIGPKSTRVYAQSVHDFLRSKQGEKTLTGALPVAYALGQEDSNFFSLFDDLERLALGVFLGEAEADLNAKKTVLRRGLGERYAYCKAAAPLLSVLGNEILK